jgi:hypothetical protein
MGRVNREMIAAGTTARPRGGRKVIAGTYVSAILPKLLTKGLVSPST